MADLFPIRPKIVIHRDNDFLTPEEIDRWGEEYRRRGMAIFCPSLPDIESYYARGEHVGSVYNISDNDANRLLSEICTQNEAKFRGKFRDKRRNANLAFWRDGGGPATDELWAPVDPPSERTTLGKDLIPRINEEFPRVYGERRNLFSRPSASLVAELREFLAETIEPQLARAN
jgi:hypothetical protein